MVDEGPRRARSLEEYRQLQARLGELADTAAAIGSYEPRPGDVVIAPFAKCGTTWLQQIFHCLRTRGDTDYDDISRVVPWIETARYLDLDLGAPQRAEPRGFKSHLAYGLVPHPARAIVSFRDPKDAFVSTFRFMDGWFIEPGTVTIEEFSEQWLASEPRPGDYWDHLLSWWEQRDRDDVLLLSYEGMILDAEGTIRRVAQFCGIELDAGLLALTLERSSLGYMRSHDGQFDDLLMREAAERHGLLPGGGESSKVRTGGVGGHRHELPARVGEAIDARWVERVPPEHGLPDYASLVAALG